MISFLNKIKRYWQKRDLIKSYYQTYGWRFILIIKDKFFGKNFYQIWHERNDLLDVNVVEQKKEELKHFSFQPKISIIVPVYNTNHQLLHKMIQSVLVQIYPNWELCIVDDASTDLDIKVILKQFENNRQIKIKYREKNGNISAASNDALEMATGDYITFLDHDDELCQHALFEVVKVLQTKRDIQLLYSDEDRIDENSQLLCPYFKAPFSIELLRVENYFCHLTVIAADLVRKSGGFRAETNAAQDWDLFLRIVEQINYYNIIHIPKILYHWRIVKTSVSNSIKTQRLLAIQKNLVQDHVKRMHLEAEVKLNSQLERPYLSYRLAVDKQLTLSESRKLSQNYYYIELYDEKTKFYIISNKFLKLQDVDKISLKRSLAIFQQQDVAAICQVKMRTLSLKQRDFILADFASKNDSFVIPLNYQDHEAFYNDYHPSLFVYLPLIILKDSALHITELNIQDFNWNVSGSHSTFYAKQEVKTKLLFI